MEGQVAAILKRSADVGNAVQGAPRGTRGGQGQYGAPELTVRGYGLGPNELGADDYLSHEGCVALGIQPQPIYNQI